MKLKLLSERKQTPTFIAYHGTSTNRWSKIGGEGLLPHADKVWDVDDATQASSSRASLPGTYITTNLMTAMSSSTTAAKKSGGNRVIIILQYSPRTAFDDEDNISGAMSSADAEAGLANDYMAAQLYGAKLRNMESWDYAVNKYIDAFFEFMTRVKEKKITPQLRQAIIPMLKEALVAEMMRVLSYSSEFDYKRYMSSAIGKIDWDNPPPRPSSQEAEETVLKIKDKITRAAKSFAYHGVDEFNYTARIGTPVMFRGRNKIIAAVELVKHPSVTYRTAIRVLYGKVPSKFITDWQRVQGEYEEIA